MENIKVSVNIRSKDSKQSFKTEGVYKNDRLIFTDPDGNKNFVIIKEQEVEYHKRGSIEMKYTFKKREHTSGLYNYMGNQFNFDIITDRILLQQERIYIKYRLMQNNELVNDTVLEIKYCPKEEELS